MSTFRVNKNKNYTVMSNYHLKDVTLSLKAIGLLSKMLSLPETWDYSVNGLVAICKENKTAVQNTLKELEEHCYLKRTRTKDKSGRFDYIYDVYEVPYIGNATTEEPRTENLVTVNQCTDNVSQLNTKGSITKESITKEEKGIYEQVVDLFNETCVSFPHVTALSDRRKKAIHARLKTYTIEDFRKCFEIAEASDFLKGKNNRDWSANFDWMIKDANMAKILDGNYTDHRQQTARQTAEKPQQKPKEINVDDFRRADGTIDCDAYMRAQYS